MKPGFYLSSWIPAVNFPVTTADGRNFTLLEPIIYIAQDGVQYRIPTGAESDGASTPSVLWPTIPPFGSYWKAAYLHDAAYRNTLEVWDGQMYVKARLTKDACDLLLKDAMIVSGTHAITYEEIYEGVHVGGQSSFDNDRKLNP